MGIYIFTDKPAGLKDKFPKAVKIQSQTALPKFVPDKNDKTFIEVTGLKSSDIKELMIKAKEIGSSGGTSVEGAKFLSSSIKLPAGNVFPGWKKMQSGMSVPFYLLYCSIEGKTSLDSRFNEKTVAAIHKRFVEFLKDHLEGTEGIIWMNTGRDYLLLFPPKQKSIEKAVNACMRMLVSAPMFTLECLDSNLPTSFIFALHYGTIKYKPPGQTGTVVSDAINFVFHLGTKKAELGRLTISGDLPGVTIPKQLQDCFVSTKDFEGRKIFHTKKFEYPKNWV